MIRPSRDEINLKICNLIAERSTCGRARVGCVITQNNRIVSTGYNGPAGNVICECNLSETCELAIHAEANAIVAAARHGIILEGAKLYCSWSPCINCSRLIIQSGIKEIHYIHRYRKPEGIDLLINNGIKVYESL